MIFRDCARNESMLVPIYILYRTPEHSEEEEPIAGKTNPDIGMK